MKLTGVEADLKRIEDKLQEINQERTKLMEAHKALRALVDGGVDEPAESLSELIVRVLKAADAEHLQLRDIHKALLSMGRRFKGPNPKMSIYSALKRNPELFKHAKDKGWGIATKGA